MAYRLKLRVAVMNGGARTSKRTNVLHGTVHRTAWTLTMVLWLAVAAPAAAVPADDDSATRRAVATTPVAVQQVRLRLVGVRDDAAMVILGAALIALGCVVRRAA